MPKTKEEVTIRYVEGAVTSAARLRRYLISVGFKESEATKRSINQALGMLESANISKEKAIEIIKEIKSIAETLLRELEED